MSITGIPQFADGEIPSAAKLNQLGDAITNKFGGAVTPGDMTWPFVVQGNIDFDQTYGIVGLRTFWNIINAAEYDSLDDAITAAEDAGGTCVLIPPDTTITADGVNVDTSGITIMGCGKTSILKLTSGSSSGYLLRTGAGSLSNISIESLQLDGQSTGAAQIGVIVRKVDAFTMRDVWVKNFTGVGVQLTNDGTDGNACTDAKILNCRFTGGSTHHLQVIDCDGLQISGFKSTSAPAVGILMEPAATAGLIKRIMLNNVDIETPTGIGISILGASGTPNANWSYIWMDHCVVTDAAADAFNIGEASKILKYVSIRNCDAPEATSDAFVVNVNIGVVQNCSGHSAGGDGIDLVSSDTVSVTGCEFRAAGAYGCDLDGTTDAHIVGNNFTGASTAAYLATSATTPRIHGNVGAVNSPAPSGIGDGLDNSRTGSAGDMGFSYTIPANGVRIGDVIRIRVYLNYTHSAGSLDLEARFGGTGIGSIGATSATTDALVQWDATVVALSGAGSCNAIISVSAEAGPTNKAARSGVTIDFTTDTAVTFQATSLGAGSTVQLRGIHIDIIGAT